MYAVFSRGNCPHQRQAQFFHLYCWPLLLSPIWGTAFKSSRGSLAQHLSCRVLFLICKFQEKILLSMNLVTFAFSGLNKPYCLCLNSPKKPIVFILFDYFIHAYNIFLPYSLLTPAPTPSSSTPSFHTLSISCSFYFIFITHKFCLCCLYTHEYGAIRWCLVDLPWAASLKKTDSSLLQKSSVVKSFSTNSGGLGTPLLCTL